MQGALTGLPTARSRCGLSGWGSGDTPPPLARLHAIPPLPPKRKCRMSIATHAVTPRGPWAPESLLGQAMPASALSSRRVSIPPVGSPSPMPPACAAAPASSPTASSCPHLTAKVPCASTASAPRALSRSRGQPHDVLNGEGSSTGEQTERQGLQQARRATMRPPRSRVCGCGTGHLKVARTASRATVRMCGRGCAGPPPVEPRSFTAAQRRRGHCC